MGSPPEQGGEAVKAVASTSARRRRPTPAVMVIREVPGEAPLRRRFTTDFRIGRDEDCGLRIESQDISRQHAEIFLQDGEWWVRDLQSTNGTLLEGTLVDRAPLPPKAALQLGAGGPLLQLEVTTVAEEGKPAGETTVARLVDAVPLYTEHYLAGKNQPPGGPRTQMIRQAFAVATGRRRRLYLAIIGAVVLAGGAVGVVTIRQGRELGRQQAVAKDVFYAMKALELQLTELEGQLGDRDDPRVREQLAAGRARFADLQASYDRFLEALKIYGDDVPEQHRLIVRIARVFGECEVAMPAELIGEVERYIEKWREGSRFQQAVRRAEKGGFAPLVVREMVQYHLPPHFFYVAMQESDFRIEACGPKTRWGVAKGPWQMIPSTAIAYGLRTGPLYLLREHDPRDERHDFAKATAAAARYLRDLYNKDAQGSGLLTVASYNWGESNVRELIRSLPENPRDRNFWKLLIEHRRRMPRETYAYTFKVLAASVIGENPRLFGFDVDSPIGAAVEARAR